jgi:hypothetical protein
VKKKTVQYNPDTVLLLEVGHRALVEPFDHPDAEHVTNTQHVATSIVQKINEDGSFETEFSLYVPRTTNGTH